MKIIKIRHLAFALMFVSSLMWSTLRAATYTITVNDIKYSVNTTTGEATCTGPTSSSLKKNNVVILDKVSYNGTDYPVTSIGSSAFSSCSGLTGTLTIPNSVQSIGAWAFTNCSGFTGVYITDLEAWCKIDFGNTHSNPLYYAKNLYLNGEPIVNLVIPETSTEIKANTFCNAENINGSLTIGENVRSIGSYAFFGCTGLSGALTIPNSVTTIDRSAFSGCSGFDGSLTIGENVQSIGSYAFHNCSGFTGSLTIPNSVQTISDYAFQDCFGFTGSLTIGENVQSIGEWAFSGCSGFTGSLTIPNSVQSIGAWAFYSCQGFTGTLTIGENVRSIGNYAFMSCSGLTGSLTIPNSVQSIGNSAFKSCSGFTGSLTIGNSVTSIGDDAFKWCSGFPSVTSLSITPPVINNNAFYYYSIPLYVPAESVNDYKNANDWEKFTNINPIPVEASSVTISAQDATLLVGQNYTLTAEVEPADATDKTIAWSSDAEGVATVDQDGKVTAVSVGTANITATCGEATATCVVTVKTLTCDDVTVTPGNGSTEGDENGSAADNTQNGGSLIGNDLTLRVGQTASVNLNVAVESDVAPEFEWSLSTDGDKVVTMTVAEETLSASFTGMALGETTYSVKLANTETVLASGKVKVIAQNPVKSLSIEPAQVTMAQNALAVQLEAKINPADASVTTLTWTTSDEKVATVSADGKVTPVAQGTATITATTTDGTELSATCAVTVTAPIDDNFGFEFDESVVGGAEGISLYLGDTYTFTPKAQDGYVLPEVISWSSSDDTTVSVDNEGKISALKVGEATVTASAEVNGETVTATCKVTVLPIPASSVTISAEDATLFVGQIFALTAEVKPEDTTYPTITWKSDKESVATVDEKGTVTAIAAGTANITATCGEVSATCVVTVKTLTSDDVTVTPGIGTTEGDEDGSVADNTQNGGSLIGNDLTLRVGQTAGIVLEVAIESDVAPEFEWSLATDGEELVKMTVAEETLSASFTGLAIGETTYSVKLANTDSELVSGKVKVIAATPIESLTLEPAELSMAQNALPIQLTAKINPENASVTALTWTTSDEKVATVSADGKVTPVAQGTATITATTTDGTELSATCAVTVTDPIDDNFGFEFDESVMGGAEGISLYLGDTYTFTPKAQDGYVLPEVINWSSSDDTTVSVDNDGKITALKVGEATVTATAEVNGQEVTASCKVTVLPIAASSVTISAEDATLLVGQTFVLTAEVEPANTTYPDITWASDNTAVATVGTDGTVTAVALGTANITATCGQVSSTCVVTVKTLTSDDVTVTPGNGTTEGNEDGSDADNTQNGGSLIGNDLTLRVGQTAELVIKLNEELTVAPSFNWTLAEGGNAFVTLTVSDDTLTASFTGIDTGATTYSIYVEGQKDALLTANILVLDKDGAGVDDITVDGSETIKVYNLQGMRMNVSDREGLRSLPRGVYIVNGKKELVR